jgi:NAD(P)-dependent dehydrogenase (short-subunit alcohol dehydrogenase family)
VQIQLSGKTAIVTGAASGIGLAIVLEYLASEIEWLVAVDVAKEPPAQLAAALREHAGRVVYCHGDVTLEATAKRFSSLALEKTGRVDVMVNNAGVNVVRPLHEHTEAEWDFIVDTNVKALFWSAKYILPAMIKQNGGVILNTGSISGHVGILGQGAYGPSKGAVHQMTRQMAIEYAKYGIRVNAIALGTVDTPILDKSASESKDPAGFRQSLLDMHPIGRIASPQEVARFFTYLASDDASFFTGAILSMDGGFIAK